MTERCTNAMLWNISYRFPSDIMDILDAFSIFNLENILTDQTSNEFSVYGCNEVNVLCNRFFKDDDQQIK